MQSTYPVRTPHHADDVAIGARHTCGLEKGAITCWGDDAHGQLAAPAVPGATRLAAGGQRTCADVDGGKGGLVCWGEGPALPPAARGAVSAFGVGNGRVCAALLEPKRVECTGMAAALPGATVTQLAVGLGHVCALLDDGSVQCWGKNDAGQVGDGTTNDVAAPVLVNGLPKAVEVRTGDRHTCARLANNTVACWGDNHAHQLANGTTQPSVRPYPVVGIVGALELALGGDSVCARLAEGGARCWGSNVAGQLGDGTIAEHDVPMPIRAPR